MSETKIPDKLYYFMGEVNKITGLKPHVLRYWETEFPALNPKKNEKGKRIYQKKDIELVLKIKELLYEKKFTIKGAKEELKRKRKEKKKEPKEPKKAAPPPDDNREFLLKIHHELKMLNKTLKGSKSDDLFGD
jgi:DNA-binding transcriptional MerR regulator